jgi:cytoskeletal protein RodZ
LITFTIVFLWFITFVILLVLLITFGIVFLWFITLVILLVLLVTFTIPKKDNGEVDQQDL